MKKGSLVMGIDERNGEWFGVAQFHEQCKGPPHRSCKLTEVFESGPFKTSEAAVEAVKALGARLQAAGVGTWQDTTS